MWKEIVQFLCMEETAQAANNHWECTLVRKHSNTVRNKKSLCVKSAKYCFSLASKTYQIFLLQLHHENKHPLCQLWSSLWVMCCSWGSSHYSFTLSIKCQWGKEHFITKSAGTDVLHLLKFVLPLRKIQEMDKKAKQMCFVMQNILLPEVLYSSACFPWKKKRRGSNCFFG